MRNLFKRLWNDDRGNAIILAGMSLPLLVGAAGLATDTIQWTLWKRQLQRAADSAAIAGVYQREQQNTQTAVEAAVNTDLNPTASRKTFNERTGHTLLSGYPSVELLDNSGDMRNRVRVTLQIQQRLIFSSVFMSTPPIIEARAEAASLPGDEYCVIGLDPRANVSGIDIAGSTYLDLGDCSLIANSSNPSDAATNTGNGSTAKAKSLAAVGGVQKSKNWSISSYDPGSTAATDPFSALPIPPKCSAANTFSLPNNSNGFPVNRTGDTAGGVYCISGGGQIKGQLLLGSGTYVVDGGDLSMSASDSKLACTSCTIIMTNYTDPTKTGSLKLTGGTVDVTAPTTTGVTYRGVAFYQDRRATDDNKAGANKINGNSSSGVTGAIYFPGQSLEYNGGGAVTARCLQIIARRVTFSGNSKMKVTNECAGAGLDPITGGGRRVRLTA